MTKYFAGRQAPEEQYVLTVMSPGEKESSQLLTSPVYNANIDNLQWRARFCCLGSMVCACAIGEDGNAKELYATLGMICFAVHPFHGNSLLKSVLMLTTSSMTHRILGMAMTAVKLLMR